MRYVMKGGNPLAGEVTISGAKNAALGILAAAIMSDETVIIENLPDVRDVAVMLEAFREIGVLVDRSERHRVKINAANIFTACADNPSIKKIRAGYYLLGALLGKYHHAEVSMPGGCNIGNRPIDQHLKGFRMLGAVHENNNSRVILDAKELKGAHIFLDMASVGATINLMLAAVLAKGNTTIENAAKEPHIVDVANMLNSMGAKIKGAGMDTIRITGVERLHGTEYAIIPDQIEAGTFMMAAAVTRGDVTVRPIIPTHMDAISAKLMEMGCEIIEQGDSIRVVGRPALYSCNVKTQPYPGFPTDMQPQMGVALSLAEGVGTITESIFENRFKYVDELSKMGADTEVKGSVAIFKSSGPLKAAELVAPDLRAGAALVLAGLAAEGVTVLDGVDYVLRGYEDFDEKLRGLGAEIILTDSEEDVAQSKLRIG
ncbi:MAG: UDP-N-acetylglucosamine 1-carboxyvinyltransferase [Lachnospiraceae bacterium]|nr:UDP-N-acetylglucosamine 1-carboxyvinyltransferase [Lachnospiraceae bacterium]